MPVAVGALDAGRSWRHLPLLFAWLVGYFAFFAAGLWLRSRGKRRYWPPVRTYGVLAVALAVVVIVIAPEVLHWAVVFLPLLGLSLWCPWRRMDRSLLNDGVTVLAACRITGGTVGVGERHGKPGGAPLGGAWGTHGLELGGGTLAARR